MSGMTNDHTGIGGFGELPRPTNEDADACLNLIIITNLASVNTDVLKAVRVGDILPVTAQSADGPVVLIKDGTILGTVLSRRLVQLLNCMNKGTEYEAEVIKIEEAICQVKISAMK